MENVDSFFDQLANGPTVRFPHENFSGRGGGCPIVRSYQYGNKRGPTHHQIVSQIGGWPITGGAVPPQETAGPVDRASNALLSVWIFLHLSSKCTMIKSERAFTARHAPVMSVGAEVINPLYSEGNYSATSNNMKLVHWPLMDGLLHLVQRGGAWAGCGKSPPRCTKSNSPPINGQCTNHCIAI